MQKDNHRNATRKPHPALPCTAGLDFVGTFQQCPKNVPGTFQERPKNVPGTSQEHPRNVPGTSQERARNSTGTNAEGQSQECNRKTTPRPALCSWTGLRRNIPAMPQERSKNIPRTFQERPRNVPGTSQEHARNSTVKNAEGQSQECHRKTPPGPALREHSSTFKRDNH